MNLFLELKKSFPALFEFSRMLKAKVRQAYQGSDEEWRVLNPRGTPKDLGKFTPWFTEFAMRNFWNKLPEIPGTVIFFDICLILINYFDDYSR